MKLYEITTRLNKMDLMNLCDIIWYLKGYINSQTKIDVRNDFCHEHIETLSKIINNKDKI